MRFPQENKGISTSRNPMSGILTILMVVNEYGVRFREKAVRTLHKRQCLSGFWIQFFLCPNHQFPLGKSAVCEMRGIASADTGNVMVFTYFPNLVSERCKKGTINDIVYKGLRNSLCLSSKSMFSLRKSNVLHVAQSHHKMLVNLMLSDMEIVHFCEKSSETVNK